MTIYGIKDKVTKKVEAVVMAENDKTVVRQLAFTGYWKINRLEDTEIIDICEIKEAKCRGRMVNINKEIEELKIHLENKAKEVDKKEKTEDNEEVKTTEGEKTNE